MKTNVLILHFNMELGGAESSLIGLLDAFDYEKYEVDLLLYAQSGALLSAINPNVNVLHEIKEYKALTETIKSNFANNEWKIGLARILAKLICKLSRGALHFPHNYKMLFHKLCIPFLPKIEKEYDLAISFNDPHYIIGSKVTAGTKMAWFHTDASRIEFYDPIEKEMWGKVNYIVNVSEDCKREFDKKHPYLQNKSIVIENILSKNLILKRCREEISEDIKNNQDFVLLSIGRFSAQKNFDNVPDICKKIRKKGLNVKWYLIGYGGDEELIRTRIKEAGMQEYVIILGKKDNPYPYIKACDIYVQPSRYEGKCVAVREAQLLGKPVVITNYATAGSQLDDGVDGIIVPMDNEGCAEGIAALLKDTDVQQHLIENTRERDYTNASEIEKIAKLCL